MRQVLAPALGDGLLSSEGDTGRKRRQLAAPTLDRQSVLAEAPIIIGAATELADTLTAVPQAQPIDINDSIAGLLVRTIARIFGDERIEPLLVAFLKGTRTRRVADFLQVPAWLQGIYRRDVLR